MMIKMNNKHLSLLLICHWVQVRLVKLKRTTREEKDLMSTKFYRKMSRTNIALPNILSPWNFVLKQRKMLNSRWR